MPRVQCIKCGRTGNLTTKKTKSHGTTYEYYYIQHYIKETDKIEWCYLGKYDRLPQDYKDKLEQNAVHKESSYIQDYTQTSKDSKKAIDRAITEEGRGCPSLVKGDRLRTCWRRPAWVQTPPPAPFNEPTALFGGYLRWRKMSAHTGHYFSEYIY